MVSNDVGGGYHANETLCGSNRYNSDMFTSNGLEVML